MRRGESYHHKLFTYVFKKVLQHLLLMIRAFESLCFGLAGTQTSTSRTIARRPYHLSGDKKLIKIFVC